MGRSVHPWKPRRSPGLLALLVLASLPALAAAPVPGWSVGGHVGMLLREEAGGQASPLFAGGPQVELVLSDLLRLEAAYAFSWAGGSASELTASSAYHRVSARLEAGLLLRSAWLFVGAGPLVAHQGTTLRGRDPGQSLEASSWRAGLNLAGGVAVRLPGVSVRLQGGVQWLGRRTDVVTGVGLLFPLGAAREVRP